MRIGVIGSGRIGTALAKSGCPSSRGPESLGDLVAELGGAARAASVEEAAGFGEIVVVAIPLGRIDELPPQPFAGRIVIDANNYYSSRDGEIPELESDETTSSELITGAPIVAS